MQAEVKKTEEGYFARKIVCDPWFRGRDQIRVGADEKPIRIQPWINPQTRSSLWIMDRVCMSMMRSTECETNEFRMKEQGRRYPKWMAWDHPVILICQNIYEYPNRIRLLNPDGYPLSGSNIYSGGSQDWSLCLGQAFNPFTLNPVELLIQNDANADLTWMGEALEGEFDKKNIFQTSVWPTGPDIIWQPPQIIKESLSALSQPS